MNIQYDKKKTFDLAEVFLRHFNDHESYSLTKSLIEILLFVLFIEASNHENRRSFEVPVNHGYSPIVSDILMPK